jgi:alpha-L-fucosidase
MIRELADCRRYRSNMLMNVEPMEDGSVREIDRATLNLMGRWVEYFGEAIYNPEPTNIEIEGKPDDFILKYENCYYLFCYNLPMSADPNVAVVKDSNYASRFQLKDEIEKVVWLDNGAEVIFEQENTDVTVMTVPYTYGRSLVVRVAKIICK